MTVNVVFDGEYLGCKTPSSVASSCLLSCKSRRSGLLHTLVCGVDSAGQYDVLCLLCLLYIRVIVVLNSTYAFLILNSQKN